MRRLLALPLLAAALVAPATARADWHGFYRQSTTCHTNAAGLIYAHFHVMMWVRNGGPGLHWATNMRVKARLVPPGSGWNYTRSWRTTRFPVHSDLLQDHWYRHSMAVNTEAMSPDADWRVQVKLIWDRKAPFADVVQKLNYPFRTANCKPYNGYSTIGYG